MNTFSLIADLMSYFTDVKPIAGITSKNTVVLMSGHSLQISLVEKDWTPGMKKMGRVLQKDESDFTILNPFIFLDLRKCSKFAEVPTTKEASLSYFDHNLIITQEVDVRKEFSDILNRDYLYNVKKSNLIVDKYTVVETDEGVLMLPWMIAALDEEVAAFHIVKNDLFRLVFFVTKERSCGGMILQPPPQLYLPIRKGYPYGF